MSQGQSLGHVPFRPRLAPPGVDAGRISLLLDASKTLTAVFAPDRFRVSVNVVGRGRVTSVPKSIACPGRCAAAFPSFEHAELRARPAKGWRLRGWSGDCSGREQSCFVSVERASRVRATFVKSARRR